MSEAVLVFDSASEADTRRLARALAACLEAGDVVGLVGTLGAGKTALARGICAALGVPREAGVSSPTYALVNLYDGGALPLAHLDLYRLEDADELEGLGFRDLLSGERALLIEWPERVPGVLDVATWRVDLEDRGPESRRVSVQAPDEDARDALSAALGLKGAA